MAMTLEQKLAKEPDEVLLDIQLELIRGVVPATGYAHTYVRVVNKMIDNGDLCINTSSYRKVYLPSLAKAVQKEIAKRWVTRLRNCKGASDEF